jgi:hypothetical protein
LAFVWELRSLFGASVGQRVRDMMFLNVGNI